MKNDRKIIMRTATKNVAFETSYCKNCKFNFYSNIGKRKCTKCGIDK